MPKSNLKLAPPPPRKASGKGLAPTQESNNLEKGGSDLVPVNIKAPRALRKEMNVFAAEHDTTVTQLILRGWELAKAEREGTVP